MVVILYHEAFTYIFTDTITQTMKTKRHSIKDIAQTLGVSITTVSFVLNGKAEEKRISKAMTEKILQYAKKIKYRPDNLAQSLRTGKSKLIVCMVEDISNYFFSRLARIIEDMAYKEGYKVIFCSNENDDLRAVELIGLFKQRRIDGYIIIPSPNLENKIKELRQENIPVVLCDRFFEGLNVQHVVVNNLESCYWGTKHLIDNGYKDIGFIATDSDQTQMRDRLLGYERAIAEAGLNSHILRIPYSERTGEKGKGMLKELLYGKKPIDAAFFATYYLTQKGLEVIREKSGNRDYFKNVGVISFDDMEQFETYNPSITAIAQPYDKIAKALIKTMLSLLNGNKLESIPNKTVLSTEFNLRQSSLTKRISF